MKKSFADNDAALQSIANRRNRKEVVVFTNGCFDILHLGHTRYLEQAKKLGDVLVVGLNSDDSVRRLKGPGRPITPAHERSEMLAALRSVDYVCTFSEDTPLELIKKIKPDILVKGGDWPVEKIAGADFVQQSGGKVLSLPFVERHSTTDIIQRIRAL